MTENGNPPKAEADYPDMESWFDDLSHEGCCINADGLCAGMHCPRCGVRTSGLVLCHNRANHRDRQDI